MADFLSQRRLHSVNMTLFFSSFFSTEFVYFWQHFYTVIDETVIPSPANFVFVKSTFDFIFFPLLGVGYELSDFGMASSSCACVLLPSQSNWRFNEVILPRLKTRSNYSGEEVICCFIILLASYNVISPTHFFRNLKLRRLMQRFLCILFCWMPRNSDFTRQTCRKASSIFSRKSC